MKEWIGSLAESDPVYLVMIMITIFLIVTIGGGHLIHKAFDKLHRKKDGKKIIPDNDRPITLSDSIEISTFHTPNQHTVSAAIGVKLVHTPTGTIVCCGKHKTQHKNYFAALETLEKKLALNLSP